VKLTAGLVRHHHIDRGGQRDVVARLDILRRAGEPVKLVEFAPNVALGEATTHIVAVQW
jgi:hypothetical protein